MDIRNITIQSAKIALPLVLGGAILFWMYRDFDFEHIEKVLAEEMNWSWMLLSFPFGILAQMFRGWRWKQTLEPIGESPRKATAIHAVFLSYAASLVVPRIGEFTRCGVLRRYDGVSFAKALGTVVTERAIDTLLMGVLALLTLLMQMDVFTTFFTRTGTSVDAVIHKFSTMGYVVTAICGVAVLLLLHFLLRKLSLYNKVKATVGGIWQGIISLRAVNNIPLFVFYTLGIWVSYFLHYYLTFFCFDFTATLGLECSGHLCGGKYSRDSAHPQRRRPLAFCREDHAHPLWSGRCQCALFRAHRPHRADHAGDSPWRLQLGGSGVYQDTQEKRKYFCITL